MKTLKITTISLIFILLSCSKDDAKTPASSQTIKDCESKNYGVVTLNFSVFTDIHVVEIQNKFTNGIRIKYVNQGIANDTLQLNPSNYKFGIKRQINPNETTITNIFDNRNVTQCSTLIINTNN